MIITIYKNTNFGNNDLVWNVPHPNYNFLVHERQTFADVQLRFPLLTTTIIVEGVYDFQTAFYDYMIIDDSGVKTYYFIKTIIAERNLLIFSVVLDAMTTHNILSKHISGVIVRKHDTNPLETRFDYPTALNVEGIYQDEIYSIIGYAEPTTRFIESTVNLSEVNPSVVIGTGDGASNIIVPTLPKPNHKTEYKITTFGGNITLDDTRAFTLYLNDLVSNDILNTVRGLSGDGAISDSYTVPTEAITVQTTGAEVATVTGKLLTKTSTLKLELDFNRFGTWVPLNEAIKGMFSVSLISLQEKSRINFPAWDLQDSVDVNGFIQCNLWCDPKPSGAPYCCPTQVKTLYPNESGGIINLATTEVKSVRGGQWLRNPLIYNTASGELFSAIETRLQRERVNYERNVSMHQLELTRREREIQIAQADFNFQHGVTSGLIGSGISLFQGDFKPLLGQAQSIMGQSVNRKFVEQMNNLQAYQLEAEKQLISIAHANNLKNLNIQEQIRRVVPRQVAFAQNESMGSYEGYNGFAISLSIPDINTLKAKDMEYSKYGYPVYESVKNFNMLNHLRQNHTVYQFEAPLVEIGGQVGDMVRTILQSGIRILSNMYTTDNILNNPKIQRSVII